MDVGSLLKRGLPVAAGLGVLGLALSACSGGSGDSDDTGKPDAGTRPRPDSLPPGKPSAPAQDARESTVHLETKPYEMRFSVAHVSSGDTHRAVELLGTDGHQLPLSLNAGTITFDFSNTDDGAPHNFVVYDRNGSAVSPHAQTQVLGSGQSEAVSVDLEPGKYTYSCTLHEGMGMAGDLVVE